MTNTEAQATEKKPEEVLYNEGLIPVLYSMNEELFKSKVYGEQVYLEIHDKITEAERQQKARKDKSHEEPNDAKTDN